MSDDEARLYDPTEGDEESENTLNIDAASTSTSVTNTNDVQEENAESNTPLPTSNGEVKHRWFILEPAVFLVFLAFYLSGKL